jgi:C1A family cysteine protease
MPKNPRFLAYLALVGIILLSFPPAMSEEKFNHIHAYFDLKNPFEEEVKGNIKFYLKTPKSTRLAVTKSCGYPEGLEITIEPQGTKTISCNLDHFGFYADGEHRLIFDLEYIPPGKEQSYIYSGEWSVDSREFHQMRGCMGNIRILKCKDDEIDVAGASKYFGSVRCCIEAEKYSGLPDLIIGRVGVGRGGFYEENSLIEIELKNVGDKETCLIEASLTDFSGEEICRASSNFCLFPGQSWALKCRPDFSVLSVSSFSELSSFLIIAEADPENRVKESDENNNMLLVPLSELLETSEPFVNVMSTSINPFGELTASKDSEYGRIYAEDGEKVSFKVDAQSRSGYPLDSIQIKVVNNKGNEEFSENYRCSKATCSKSWEIPFNFGDNGLYYIYTKIIDQRGLSSYTEPGGFRVFVKGWEKSLPEEFSWKYAYGLDWMTPIKDQGICDSCWAFATLGAIESVYSIEQGNPTIKLDLSEQHLVSCDESNYGCFGGWSDQTLNFIKDSGVTEERYFAYNSGNLKCNFPEKPLKDKMEYRQLIIAEDGGLYEEIYYCPEYLEYGCDSSKCPESPCSRTSCNSKLGGWDENLWGIDVVSEVSPTDDLKLTLIKNGPLAVTMTTTYRYSQSYIEKWDFSCDNYEECRGSHDVVLLGYKEHDENCYESIWILKNSWGIDTSSEDYLKKGYFFINYGECDIGKREAYYVEGVHKI